MAALNQIVAPWAQTAQGIGHALTHPRIHAAIAHPNVGHRPRPALSPFMESQFAGNALRANAKHSVPFSAPGGLHRPTRK